MLSVLAIVAAVVASFAYLSLDLSSLVLGEAPRRQMGRFVLAFFPPDLSPELVGQVGQGMLQTLAVSALGTALAVLGGAILALPAAGRFGRVAKPPARMLLNGLRGVPELVWAALMVLAAGVGPFAGALALGLHTTGVLGRLFAESLENAPRSAEASLRDLGAGRVAAFLYGMLPIVAPQCLGYTLYRWEIELSAWRPCSDSSAEAASGRCCISTSRCSSNSRPRRCSPG